MSAPAPYAQSRSVIYVVGLILLISLTASAALAHKVNIFAYVEGETVHTESYFNDGTKCSNASVFVYDPSGKRLVEGTTDAKGVFNFPYSGRHPLRIVLEASMGHRAEHVLEVGPADAVATLERTADTPLADGGDDAIQIQAAVEAALDRKLSPLIAKLDRLQKAQEQVGIRDIIGGIGYIVGLMGLAVYLRQRRK